MRSTAPRGDKSHRPGRAVLHRLVKYLAGNPESLAPLLTLAWLVIVAIVVVRVITLYADLPVHVSNYTVTRPGEDELLLYGLVIPLVVVTVSWAIARLHLAKRIRERRRQRMDALMSKGSDVTPEEFLGDELYTSTPDFTGIYVLHNLSNGKYYVGQSVHVLQRVRQHFTGHGNGDVYADWRYGNAFAIHTIRLVGSGYDNLNALEREFIDYYDAHGSGYNRTSGNHS